MLRRLSSVAILLAVPLTIGSAQRWDYDVEGAESCREVWREYGRSRSGRPRAVHCEVRELGTIAPRATLEVEGPDHSGVEIVGAQRRDVRIRLVIQAQGETVAEAQEVARRVTLDINRTPLRPDVPDYGDERRGGSRRFAYAMVLVDAPIESNISASVMHAPLSLENLRGRIDVSAEHGPLDMRNVSGDVRARSRHGPLSIHVSTPQWQGAGLDAHAAHGPLTISVPRGFNAQLEIGAEHGPLDIDFPITVTRFDRSRIETKLGNGGPLVRAHAEHGPLSFRMNR